VALDHPYAQSPSQELPSTIPGVNQDPKREPNTFLASSLAAAERMIKAGVRDSTSRKYDAAYSRWKTFCSQAAVSPLPATAQHVSAFLAVLANETKSVSTVEAAYAAISHAHRMKNFESLTSEPAVALLMRSIRRQFQKPRKTVKPITTEILKSMMDNLYQPCHGADGLAASLILWRTTWRIVLAFYLFARFDDMSRLEPCDLEFYTTPHLYLKVHLRGGKTDCSNQVPLL